MALACMPAFACVQIDVDDHMREQQLNQSPAYDDLRADMRGRMGAAEAARQRLQEEADAAEAEQKRQQAQQLLEAQQQQQQQQQAQQQQQQQRQEQAHQQQQQEQAQQEQQQQQGEVQPQVQHLNQDQDLAFWDDWEQFDDDVGDDVDDGGPPPALQPAVGQQQEQQEEVPVDQEQEDDEAEVDFEHEEHLPMWMHIAYLDQLMAEEWNEEQQPGHVDGGGAEGVIGGVAGGDPMEADDLLPAMAQGQAEEFEEMDEDDLLLAGLLVDDD